MRTPLTLAALALTLTLALGACGNDELEPAAEALRQQIDYASDGQHGRRWQSIHPAQQAIVTLAEFEACQDFDIPEVDITIKEAFDEPTPIPGTDLTVPSRALTAVFEFPSDTETETVHMVDVDGTWRWVMTQDSVTECDTL